MPLLELRDIVKTFPGVRALDGVSLDLVPGEIHALCGENGAGKSTLLKVLTGVHPAGSFSGEVRLDGKPVHFRGLRDSEDAGIVLIAQELVLVPGLSVSENLVLGREPTRLGLIDRAAVREHTAAALARVGLDADPEAPVSSLGVGRQQLLEIARALSKEARVLVLDKPTSALTESDAQRLLDLLSNLRRRGTAVLYVSHRLEEIERLADRVTVLRDGRTVASFQRGEAARGRVVAAMVGREVSTLFPKLAPPRGEVLLSVEGWTLDHPLLPGRRAVRDASFVLRAGEVLGIAGLMGSGRTALLSSLFGAARSAVWGRLTLPDGTRRGPFRDPREALAAGLALVGEDRRGTGIVGALSVRENLALAVLPRFAPRGVLHHAALARETAAQGERLHLKTASPGTPAAQLSGGNQQKVVLGKWLLAEPKVLLLDEPTRGIDVGAKGEIYGIVRDLAARGLGVVLASSELPEVLGLSHRVLVLNQGRVAGELPSGAATPEAVMHLASA